MSFLNKLVAIIALVCLSGCTNPTKPDAQTIPASMRSPCEPLEQLSGTTGKDLTNNIVNNAAIHHRCVDKYNALREAVSSKKDDPPKK